MLPNTREMLITNLVRVPFWDLGGLPVDSFQAGNFLADQLYPLLQLWDEPAHSTLVNNNNKNKILIDTIIQLVVGM